jgi:hypothetical protein
MASAAEVIELNNMATDFVVSQRGTFDSVIADLVVRNTLQIAKSLTPGQFMNLSEPAREALKEAASAAMEVVAPLSNSEKKRQTTEALVLGQKSSTVVRETPTDQAYRLGVKRPLERLQARFYVDQNIDPINPDELPMVKRVIWLAGSAFEKVLADPAAEDVTEIQQSLSNFEVNARQAAHLACQSANG